jgi:hypothetical protein
MNAAPILPISPVMWNSGAMPRIGIPSRNDIQSRQTWALNAMLACVFIAPFGLPVVPDV